MEQRVLPGKASSRSNGIVTEGLGKSYDGTPVLDHIDFVVEPGTMLALLGPNGAGKTTIVRILTTLLRLDRGQARVGGYDVVTEPRRVRGIIGLTGQDTAVDGLLTARENLIMIGRLHGQSTGRARWRAGELLDRFDLQDAADHLARTYSGGMRRRLDLAACLVATPPILFLDEPTTALDPLVRKTLWSIVAELRDHGTTVLLTTQNLDEADQLADRIAVIDQGRLIVEGTPASLKQQVGSERAVLRFELADDFEAARSMLGDGARARVSTRTLDMAIGDPSQLHEIMRLLYAAHLRPSHLSVTSPTLDDVFFSVTGASTKGKQ